MSTPTNRSYEVRYFDWTEIREAREWAERGNIAVHRNYDVDGLVIGGKIRSGPAFHVFGRREPLLEWARRYRLNPAWIQDKEDGWPPHFDVFGALARRFETELAKGN